MIPAIRIVERDMKIRFTYFRHRALDAFRYVVYLLARIRAVWNIDRTVGSENRGSDSFAKYEITMSSSPRGGGFASDLLALLGALGQDLGAYLLILLGQDANQHFVLQITLLVNLCRSSVLVNFALDSPRPGKERKEQRV